MHLPPEAIHEFRRIWHEEYGEDLPFEKAQIIAERFLSGVHQMLTIKDRDPGSK